MAEYTRVYQLCLDKTGFKGSKSDVVLTYETPVDVVFNGTTMTISLYGVYSVRRVYEPGHVQAEILVKMLKTSTTPTVQLMSAMLLKRPVSLFVELSHKENNTKKVDNVDTLAENYYIHDIAPQFETGKEMRTFKEEVKEIDEETGQIKIVQKDVEKEVDIYCVYIKLDIFSIDKILTLRKFSQAYLGQKLFADIVPATVGSCSLTYEAEVDQKKETKTLSLGSDVRTLSHLGYSGQELKAKLDEKGKEKTDSSGNVIYELVDAPVELIQPYLVQYDETFYDFLRRTANRTGELFYFEDGALCAGLPASTVKDIKNPFRVTFHSASTDSISVSDYTRDSVKDWAQDKSIKTLSGKAIHSDPVETGDSGFPKDVFLKRTAGTFVNDSPIASEEHYMMLFKDRFARDSVNDLWCGDDPDQIGSHVVGTLSLVLNSTSLMEMLTTFALKETEAAVKASIKSGKATDEGNQVLESEALNPQDQYAVLFSKVDKDTKHWITLDYTAKIRKGEQARTGRMICVDMGEETYLFVKLGDRITIPHDSQTYVVVGVEMSPANDWQHSYDGVFAEGASIPEKGPRIRIYAIPLKSDDDDTFYPPSLPDSPFRLAGAQPAYIIDSGDPIGQGRVRIRFPWQPSMEDAKDTFDKGKYQDNYDKTLGPFQAARKALEAVAKDIKAPLVGDATATMKDNVVDTVYNTALSEFDSKWKAHRANKIKLDKAKAELLLAEAGSPWIRMASPMATAGGGMYFKPEVGDEVMVDFESGNIERPYVTGTLYSKNIPAPKQGGRVIVSKNGHTIKMTDPSDGNALLSGLFPAWKFLQGYGAFDKFKIPMAGNTARMLGGIELTDQFGFYNIKMSSHDRSISIASPLGNVSMSALTGISIEAPNGDISISGKNVEISAYNKISITSGKNVKMAHDSHRLGWLSTGWDPEDAGKNIGKALTKFLGVGKLFDFSILRTLIEIFVRPVDGTLDIKSNRFLLLQAGGKTAAGLQADYNVKPFDDWKLEENEPRIIKAMLTEMKEALLKWYLDFATKYNTLVAAVNSMTSFWDPHSGPNGNACVSTPADLDTMLQDFFNNDPNNFEPRAEAYLQPFTNYASSFRYAAGVFPDDKREFVDKGLVLMMAAVELKRHMALYDYDHLFSKIKDVSFVSGKLMTKRAQECLSKMLPASAIQAINAILNTDNPAVQSPAVLPAAIAPPNIPNPSFSAVAPGIRGNAGFFQTKVKPTHDYIFSQQGQANTVFRHTFRLGGGKSWVKFVARRLMCLLIEQVRTTKPFNTFVIPPAKYIPVDKQGTAPVKLDFPFSDTDWPRYVDEITFEPPSSNDAWYAKMASAAWGSIKDALWKAVPWESDTWSSDKSGQILFAEEKGNSYYFTNNGATAKRPNETRQDAVCKEVKNDLKAI